MRTSTKGKVRPDDEMTSRRRLLAAYAGDEVDRLPYWAKVANTTWRTSQPQAVRDLSSRDILHAIGADGIFHVGGVTRTIRPRVSVETSQTDNVRTTVTHTPDGGLTERWTFDPCTQSRHPTEFPVKTREDLARVRWIYTDVTFEVDEQHRRAARARQREIGERGVTLCGVGTGPLMHLVQHVIGPVNTHLMLADFPGEMDELLALMGNVRLAHVHHAARHCPADVLVSVENTSTTLIGPGQFAKYCYSHLCDCGRAVEAEGKMHELHMCGHTLALLERIDTIPAASIEAFTSPTLGNTRLADGRAKAPSKTLIGGTNCCTWLRPVDQIKQYIAGELAACGDHRRIILTTAGVAPPACPMETFAEIGRWIRTQPVRM